MRAYLLSSALLVFPMIGWAQDIPVYQQEGDDLIYTGETMALEDAIDVVGLKIEYHPFEPPEFLANNRGTYIPSFVPPKYYELVFGGDGVIEGAPKGSDGMTGDLVFKKDEGLDVREDLVFGEGEGTDTREDLVFGENEGTDVQAEPALNAAKEADDLSFSESEGMAVTDNAAKSAKAEGVPEGLIKNSYGSAVTPQDGLWRVVIVEAVAIGCPPGADEQAQAQILKTRNLDVTFSKPDWHPTDLSSELASYTWTKIGQNGYFSYPYTTSEEAHGSGVSLAVSTAYFVRSETYIETWYRVRMNLAPHLAAMAGSSERCEVNILGELTRME